MPAFTKGKWSYADVSTPYEQHFIIGTVDKTGTFYAHASTKTEADAKLITAAPDMYKLLQSVLDGSAFEFDIHGHLIFTTKKADEFRKVLKRIDGTETNSHDAHA